MSRLRLQPRLQTPLRCICREAERSHQSKGLTARRSLSMLSLDSEPDSSSNGSYFEDSESTSSIGSTRESWDYDCIDDLMEKLVVEATKRYAVADPVKRVSKKAVWQPEKRSIALAVKRIDVPVRSTSDAGKSYYELRILATTDSFVSYDRDSITSVLIGYACLDGIDNGHPLRRFSFQDSQHLYEFCEQLGKKGRFEDAAF